jgi:WD40 repeat protein
MLHPVFRAGHGARGGGGVSWRGGVSWPGRGAGWLTPLCLGARCALQGTNSAIGEGHSGSITDLKISPDSQSFVSVGDEGAILVWGPAEA